MEAPIGLLLPAVVALNLAGCGGGRDAAAEPPGPEPAEVQLTLVEIASGLARPVHLAAPVGDDRMFVVEQAGTVRILRSGAVDPVPFLDLRGAVARGNEQGLLAIAFHPQFDSNGLFFINYTDLEGRTRIVRYRVGPDADRADPSSGSLVLRVAQPAGNHNGGHLLFGPDGMLYIPLGDGGGSGDTFGNGQDRSTLLGALLRIDVDGGDPYDIPTDNPFVDSTSFRPEVWAWGLRNPWRIDIDASAGLLYVADVGQNRLEEINVVQLSDAGLNFGWNVMEGSVCFGAASCDATDLVIPAVDYGRDEGCAVTGGLVYRGSAIPALRGFYLYSDFCAGWLRGLRTEAGEVVETVEWNIDPPGSVTSLGRDGIGEVYLLTLDGRVWRVEAAS